MIQIIDTGINKDDLIGIKSKIDAVLPLNKFNDTPHWSTDFINGDKVYRIQKFVQRVFEETGVIIHSQIIDLFKPKNKVYPYNMQLIKIDRNIFNTDIFVEGQICQTITPLNENCKTYVLINRQGEVVVEDLEINDYAIASYWTTFRTPEYKSWFIGKYLKYYG